ncbi:MAG: 50S ribosomal protein L28 [Actinobacteria bacterium]|nr:50S ribosomal protein L28 [Actinomycetota bacterium]
MSKKCRISKKKKLVGNNVSHSKRRTKRAQEPNLQLKWFYCPETNRRVRLKVCTRMIKTIGKKGLLPVLKQHGMAKEILGVG